MHYRWFVALLLAPGGLLSQASADTFRKFDVGSWQAAAYSFEGTRNFSHCAAVGKYKSGIFVVFAVDRKYNWSIGFANPDWKLEKGATYDLALSIDGGSRILTKGKAIGTNHVEVPL